MTKLDHWVGSYFGGAWSDPANWSAGLPGPHARVVFSGYPAEPQGTEVSLAPSAGRHPVAGTVTVRRTLIHFDSGRLVLHGISGRPTAPLLWVTGGGGLTIDAGAAVDATQSGSGVSVVSGGLEVNGTLRTTMMTLEGGGDLGNAFIGITGKVTTQGLLDRGASLVVSDGGHLTTANLSVGAWQGSDGTLSVQSDGTLLRTGNLDISAGAADIGGSAHLEIAYGTEGGADQPASITVSGAGSDVLLAHVFDQQSGTLVLSDGGQLTLGADATWLACGTVALDGGSIAGAGVLTLNGGALQAESGVQSVAGGIGVLGDGVLGAAQGATLTLDGPIAGARAMLTIGGSGMNGTVVLTDSADDYGSTAIAAGTLQLDADSVAGTGRIAFVGSNSTLAVGIGVAVDNTIAGFGAGETIDLRGIALDATTTLDFTPDNGALTVSHGTASETLHLAGSYAAAGFTMSADGYGGTDVAWVPAS